MPVGFQGPPWSHGPMNIRNSRTVSLPYRAVRSSGFTTLPRDLLMRWWSAPRICPWLRSATKGSSKDRWPMSRSAFTKKREYIRCSTACSAPPVYRSTGIQWATACGSQARASSFGEQ